MSETVNLRTKLGNQQGSKNIQHKKCHAMMLGKKINRNCIIIKMQDNILS